MTAAELTAQICAAKPIAPDGLRNRVRAIASAEPAPAFRARLRVPSWRVPRLRILLPVAAATAVAAAAAVAFIHPGDRQQNVLSAAKPPATERSKQSLGVDTTPSATDSATQSFKAATVPAPAAGRPTRYAAQLTISVKNGNALSDATTRAQTIVRDLGGYVVNVSFASAESGNASLTLRVPTARVQDALTRLAALGRVVAQQAQIEDLQATLDQLARHAIVLRARITHITALLTDTTLTSVKRADLESQRAALQNALRSTRQSHESTSQDARYATIQLQLQTAAKAVAPPPSRANRILHQAGRILAWEGAALLYILVIAGPFVLVAAAFGFTARARRRGQETRLLARS